eukprot:bmy_01216T0
MLLIRAGKAGLVSHPLKNDAQFNKFKQAIEITFSWQPHVILQWTLFQGKKCNVKSPFFSSKRLPFLQLLGLLLRTDPIQRKKDLHSLANLFNYLLGRKHANEVFIRPSFPGNTPKKKGNCADCLMTFSMFLLIFINKMFLALTDISSIYCSVQSNKKYDFSEIQLTHWHSQQFSIGTHPITDHHPARQEEGTWRLKFQLLHVKNKGEDSKSLCTFMMEVKIFLWEPLNHSIILSYLAESPSKIPLAKLNFSSTRYQKAYQVSCKFMSKLYYQIKLLKAYVSEFLSQSVQPSHHGLYSASTRFTSVTNIINSDCKLHWPVMSSFIVQNLLSFQMPQRCLLDDDDMANKGNLYVKSTGLSDPHIPELQGKELGKNSYIEPILHKHYLLLFSDVEIQMTQGILLLMLPGFLSRNTNTHIQIEKNGFGFTEFKRMMIKRRFFFLFIRNMRFIHYYIIIFFTLCNLFAFLKKLTSVSSSIVAPPDFLATFSSIEGGGAGFRFGGKGTPALAHMAAALALAISNRNIYPKPITPNIPFDSQKKLSFKSFFNTIKFLNDSLKSVRRLGDLPLSEDLDRLRRMGDLLNLLLKGVRDRLNLTGDILKLRLLTTDLDLLRRLGVRLRRLGVRLRRLGVRLRRLGVRLRRLGVRLLRLGVRLLRLGEMLKLLLPPDLDLLRRLGV